MVTCLRISLVKVSLDYPSLQNLFLQRKNHLVRQLKWLYRVLSDAACLDITKQAEFAQ